MWAQYICSNGPIAIVWLIGLIIAITRWHRHPQVSMCLSVGLVAALITMAIQWGWLQVVRTNRSWAVYVFYFVDMLTRIVVWASLWTSIFGWRRSTLGSLDSRWLQFSIRNLLVLTLVAGIFFGLLRGVIAFLGNDPRNLVGLVNIPLLLAVPIGAYLAWKGRKQHPGVSRCVFGAIGLEVFGWLLSLGLIVSSALRSDYFFTLLPLLSVLWPLISLIKWILLLCAAFGWRQEPIVEPGSDVVAPEKLLH
jgi:hypothetical protein